MMLHMIGNGDPKSNQITGTVQAETKQDGFSLPDTPVGQAEPGSSHKVYPDASEPKPEDSDSSHEVVSGSNESVPKLNSTQAKELGDIANQGNTELKSNMVVDVSIPEKGQVLRDYKTSTPLDMLKKQLDELKNQIYQNIESTNDMATRVIGYNTENIADNKTVISEKITEIGQAMLVYLASIPLDKQPDGEYSTKQAQIIGQAMIELQRMSAKLGIVIGKARKRTKRVLA